MVASKGAEGLTSRRSNRPKINCLTNEVSYLRQVRLRYGHLIGQLQFGLLDLRPVEMPPPNVYVYLSKHNGFSYFFFYAK